MAIKILEDKASSGSFSGIAGKAVTQTGRAPFANNGPSSPTYFFTSSSILDAGTGLIRVGEGWTLGRGYAEVKLIDYRLIASKEGIPKFEPFGYQLVDGEREARLLIPLDIC